MGLTQMGDFGEKTCNFGYFFNGYGVHIFRPILMGKVFCVGEENGIYLFKGFSKLS